MKKEVFLIIILLFLLPLCSAQVRINEVMPAPNITNAEWVELYSNETINLNGWILDTQNQNMTFNNAIIEDYLIITKNKEDFLSLWPFVNQSKIIVWGNMGLTNTGDNVTLNNTILRIDNTTYPSFSSTTMKNKTWALNSSNLWQICSNPTPGQQNYCPEIPQQNQTQNQTNQTQPLSSYIEIQDYPEEALFGDNIDVKVNIYRGDTSKYAVYARVEKDNGYDLSEETTIHVLTKYINYSLKIPIQLKLNCDRDYDNDTYNIIIEGLGLNISEEIKLYGKSSLCPKEEQQETQENKTEETIQEKVQEDSNNESISDNLINTESPFLTGDIIDSKGATTLKITPYLLSLLCLLIAFYTIKTKWQEK